MTTGHHGIESKSKVAVEMINHIFIAHFPLISREQYQSKIYCNSIRYITWMNRGNGEGAHLNCLLSELEAGIDNFYEGISVYDYENDQGTVIDQEMELKYCDPEKLTIRYPELARVNLTRNPVKTGDKKIVIYGIGMMGKYTGTLLGNSGFTVYAYGDSKQQLHGKKWNGSMILSDEEILRQKEELLLVIGSSRYATEIYYKLLGLGINSDNIYFPCHGFLTATCGRQYFDFFEPVKGEIFVDAGAYDGSTSIDFANWNPGYEKIYLFEANTKDKQQIINKLKQNGIAKYELIMKGVSDECKAARMHDWMYSSQVNEEGSLDIELTSIDEELGGEKATFIKMDIEGEECRAILGAKNTIKRYKPRMAISIYHKMDDIVTIPLLISSLNPEYQFAIRHYTSTPHETVLYAW